MKIVSKEDPETSFHQDSRKYQIGKHQAMITYIDFGLKNSRSSTVNRSSIKQAFLNRWRNGKLYWSRRKPLPPKNLTISSNYRPITCLYIMWKILMVNLIGEIYCSLEYRRQFPEEQKGCCRETRGTIYQLHTDQHTINEAKKGGENVAMSWLDNKKVYDMVL